MPMKFPITSNVVSMLLDIEDKFMCSYFVILSFDIFGILYFEMYVIHQR